MIRIPLRKAGVVVDHALVDDADAVLSESRGWLDAAGYVVRDTGGRKNKQRVYLHRVVAGLSPGDGFEVDHENRNRRDNQRANLRIATRAQNAQNLPSKPGSTSRHRGVSWKTREGKWCAQAQVAGHNRFLGHFDSELEAAQVASEFRAANMPFAVEA